MLIKFTFFSKILTEARRSLHLSFPLIISELAYGSSMLLATIMVARLGRDELAANILVFGIFITLILFFIGILHATGILVAHSYGAKNSQGISTTLIQGIILSIIFSLPMMLIMWFSPKIFSWTGQDSDIIKLTIPYCHALTWSMLPINLSFTIEQFLIGIALTRPVSLIGVLRVVLEIILFYILIFGKLGFPKFGLTGVGYAIVLASSLIFLVQLIYLYLSPKIHKYKLFAIFRINKRYILEFIRIGLPMGITYCLELALITAIAFLMGRIGKNTLAAHQIAHQCYVFAITIIFGVSQGTTIRVGHEVGRNDKKALKLAAHTNIGIGFSLMFLTAMFYILFPENIVSLYMGKGVQKYPKVVQYAVTFLPIAGVLQLTECVRLIYLGILRSLKDTKIPLFISIITFWGIAFPSAYFLSFPFQLEGKGIWWGLVIGLAIGALTLMMRFKKLINRLDLKALVTE